MNTRVGKETFQGTQPSRNQFIFWRRFERLLVIASLPTVTIVFWLQFTGDMDKFSGYGKEDVGNFGNESRVAHFQYGKEDVANFGNQVRVAHFGYGKEGIGNFWVMKIVLHT